MPLSQIKRDCVFKIKYKSFKSWNEYYNVSEVTFCNPAHLN